MIETLSDRRGEQIGKVTAHILIAGLFALFAYGYLAPVFFG